jgi:hypothetical protein
MNDRSRYLQPTMMLPIQARPVRRVDWTAGPAHDGKGGIQAAQNQDVCANLHGLAQQMCYAMVGEKL